MEKIKFSLLVFIVATTSILAQQKTSFEVGQGEIASNVSGKAKSNKLNPNKWEGNSATEKLVENTIVNEDNNNGITIYPFPARDLVTLIGVKEEDEIIIRDVSGKNIVEIKAKAPVEIIPIDFLESGSYKIMINGVERALPVE